MNRIGDYETFLKKVFLELERHGVQIQDLEVDHLCFRTKSLAEYEFKKIELSPIATFLGEEMVNGRPIAAFKFKHPIQFQNKTISVLEVPAPKPNSNHESGLEHVEFVIKESFENFIKKHDHLTFQLKGMSKQFNPEIEIEFENCAVKFHHQSLEDVICSEKNFIPTSFSNLYKEIPHLVYEANYATIHNFTQQLIPGYTQKLPLLTNKACQQLKLAAKKLEKQNLGFWLFDSYRPQKAVNFFKAWSLESGEDFNPIYYPKIKKSELFNQGFLSERSSHSRGSTLDLTLYDLSTKVPLDMGTIFDFFDESSFTQSTLITSSQQQNRHRLVAIMDEFGFRNYSKEWWHFTFKSEPYPFTYFDFDLKEFWPY